MGRYEMRIDPELIPIAIGKRIGINFFGQKYYILVLPGIRTFWFHYCRMYQVMAHFIIFDKDEIVKIKM